MHRKLLPFLLVCCLPSIAWSQTFSTPVRISDTTSGAHSPTMRVGRDGTIFVSWFQANADIFFSRSTDGGITFTAPVHACRQITDNASTSLLQRAPEFAIDTKGTIHLVWTEGPPKGASDVWYIQSTDNGATWTPRKSIMDSDDSANASQDFSAIACDSSNNLYVSYLDNRYIMRKTGQHYRMHVQISTDGGSTWSNPIIADKLPVLNSGTCECCRQDIAASKDGHLYIAFRTNMTTDSGDKRDIFICRSMDKGITWDSSIRAQLGDWTLTGCPTKGPHISLDAAENLHLAWNDARDDSSKLNAYYSLLMRGDTAIFPNFTINGRGQPNGQWPDVATSPTGIAAMAYMPNTSGQPVHFSYSSDGGNTWSRNVALPGAASDDQELPIIQFGPSGQVYAVWQDGTANGILFTKSSALSTVIAPGSLTQLTPIINYNSGKITLQWSKPSGLGRAPFVWYHLKITGNGGPYDYDLRDTSITIAMLPDGPFTYTVNASSTVGTSFLSSSFQVESAGVEPSSKSSVCLYPDPSHGQIRLDVSALNGSAMTIRLVDALGNNVLTKDILSSISEVLVPTTGLAKGRYQCEVHADGKNFSIPVIVE